jgi:hypothetical protein
MGVLCAVGHLACRCVSNIALVCERFSVEVEGAPVEARAREQ